MLSASGFQVFDLGVDVSFDDFSLKAKELHADIVGLSALLTTTMTGQKGVVEALQRHGLHPRVKVMIGGAPVTQTWATEIGADGYGKDALAAVALAKRLTAVSCVHILDPHTLEHRMTLAPDLVHLVQVAEMLPQFAAQSTAVVCNEVPEDIGDLYRLFLVLLYSNKPIVTGAFSPHGAPAMIEMLAADSGGHGAFRAKPRAIFDVYPSPPLHWTEFAAQNLVDLAGTWVPVEIISMPLAGAASPVTLAGSVVQHAAECLSGITIHQLAQPGAPVVWGGAPSIFDMRSGITPMGSMETCMLNVASAQVAKSLGLPTTAT
jgi:trimethylamine:corrinoid methyltransferase-like protein